MKDQISRKIVSAHPRSPESRILSHSIVCSKYDKSLNVDNFFSLTNFYLKTGFTTFGLFSD